MADPIPYVVSDQGGVDQAPDGAVPIALFGAGGGAGSEVLSVAGRTGNVTLGIGDIADLTGTLAGKASAQSVTALTEVVGSKASGSDLDSVNATATQALARANSAVQGEGVGTIWVGTQAAYDALPETDPETLYFTRG